ncbi:MAG: ABC transporter substrate-binding protein [Gaiella sp.]
MGKLVKTALALAVLALTVVTASLATTAKGTASDTFVFASSSDPVSLDPAVTSDGESFRPQIQIYETLVSQVPGTTKSTAGLAIGWKASNGGKTWTFKLRKNVRFHDGTVFDSNAVCANFDRWYNFTGALQSDSASYYYNVVFGGFKKPEKGAPGPGKALYRSCSAPKSDVAVIKLRRVFGPFIGAMTLAPFSIQSPTAMKQYGADKGKLTADGVFVPLGTYGAPGGQAVGTGPFKLESWKTGDKLVLTRNDQYWGRKAFLKTVIIRPIADNAARLQALQTGEIQGYDNVEPQDITTIQRSSKLKVLDRPSFNVGYVTINQKVKPFDNILVRKAVAHALDRAGVVKSFYAGRGIVANQFQPASVPGYSTSVVKYPYSPAKAKALLRQAGLTLPVEVEFWYPTDVSRPYMPDAKRNFQGFQASLEKSGFKVVPKSAPWRPDYLGRAAAGTAGALNLLGWTGDYAAPESFLGGILRSDIQFGLQNNPLGKKLYADLDKALTITNPAQSAAAYKRINNYIMANVLGVPYVHTEPALAFAKNVVGYKPSPTLNDVFSIVRVN